MHSYERQMNSPIQHQPHLGFDVNIDLQKAT